MIPKIRFKDFNTDWELLEVQELLKERNEQQPKSDEYPLMSFVKDIGVTPKGDKYDREFLVNDVENKKYKITKKGDFIYSSNNLESGSIGINKLGNAVISPVYSIFYPTNKTTSDFINICFQRRKFINKMLKWRQGVVYGQWKIHEKDFLKIKEYIPSKEEQIKLGLFFSKLDERIELQKRKIDSMKDLKNYTKNICFSKTGEIHKLKDILIKWNMKNKNNEITYVESISNKYGFIAQSDQFEERNVASKDLSNYYIIKKDVFGYNPSRLNVGSLALKEDDVISVVSPLYECFTTTQNNKYLLEWFDSKFFRKETISKFEGGVRNTLSFNNLCDIKINLPSKEDQQQYAKIFATFDKKIKLEELKLEKLFNLKKGLVQKMFI